jgi:dihydroflavonol-4-reductase
MKVLITGATGFVGSWIARELVAAGHDVRVLVRKTSKLDGLAGLKYEKFEGDILDKASVVRALDGVQAVIHTAASVSQRKRDYDLLFKVNVEGTRNVMEAALKHGGLRVIHTSSIAAVGATKEPIPMDETSPWTVGYLNYGYVSSKRVAEDVVLEHVARGLDAVIVNPGYVLGPGDVYLGSTRIVLEYLKGIMRWAPEGGISFCDVRDVAKAHVAALTKGKKGERYILGGINATFMETLETQSKITGLPRPRRAPRSIAKLAGALSEVVSLFHEHKYEDVNRTVIAYAHLYNFCDTKKAERELGYEKRSLESALRDTIKDFLDRKIIEPSTDELRALVGAKAPEPVLV